MPMLGWLGGLVMVATPLYRDNVEGINFIPGPLPFTSGPLFFTSRVCALRVLGWY